MFGGPGKWGKAANHYASNAYMDKNEVILIKNLKWVLYAFFSCFINFSRIEKYI